MSFSTRILFTQNYIMEGDNMHILIIEDEEQLCRSVAEGTSHRRLWKQISVSMETKGFACV